MRVLSGIVAVLFVLAALGCDKQKAGEAVQGMGAVSITAGKDGFSPNAVTFRKGAPAKLVFTRTTDETCATEVVFPELDLRKELPKDKPVAIDVPTDKERTLSFQCGMGMYKSSVVIATN